MDGDAKQDGAAPVTGGRARWLRVAGVAAFFALAAATFRVAVHVPLYTDEMGWKVIQARYGLDGGRTTSPLPTCSVTEFDVPPLLKPFRLLDTAVYEGISGPLAVRGIGVALAASWGLLLWALLRRAASGRVPASVLALLVASFATLGSMPFLVVLNRPEQVLLIGITLFFVPLVAGPPARRRSLPAELALAIAVTAGCGYFFAAHPRAVFALPLALLCVAGVLNRRPVAAATGLSVVLLCAVTLSDWSLRTQCDDPAIASILARESILSSAAQGRLGDYLAYAVALFLDDPARVLYLSPLRLDAPTTSNMIPVASGPLAMFSGALVQALLSALVVAGAVAFLLAMRDAIARRRVGLRELALAALWAFYGASVVARVTRLTYEAALMEPVMAMAALGSLWAAWDALDDADVAARLRRIGAVAFAALVATSVASQAALLAGYSAYAAGPWGEPGYLEGQRFSVSSSGYDEVAGPILETARLCRIDVAARPRHLIVDELTFFALQQARQPLLATYLDERTWGYEIRDHRALLEKVGSEGMVVGCHRVPLALQAEAVRHGEFCCLPSFVR